MLYVNKQPLSLRKTASKNSTKKLQQQLSGGRTHLSPASAAAAAAAAAGGSRHASRIGSRVHSDDEDDDDYGGGGGSEYWEGECGKEREDNGGRGGGGREGTVESKFLDAIEQLCEKRSSTREDALTKLMAILSQHYVAELLDSQKGDLMDLLKRSVKRGGTRECILAANVIALVFITAGEEDEQVLTDMAPLLKYTITNHDQPEVKAACLYTLATACYISSTPQPSHLPTYGLLHYLADLIALKDAPSPSLSSTSIHSETLVAALESFGLLFAALFGKGIASNDNYEGSNSDDDTGLGSQHEKDLKQARRLFSRMIPTIHYTLLEHPSVEVRVASGEVVGLMFEILDYYERQRRRHEDEVGINEHRQELRHSRETYQDDEEEDDDWDDDGGGDGGGGGIAPMTGPFRYRDRQDLIDVLFNLATDSDRHRSKKDRCAGRSAFRDILKYIDLDDDAGDERVGRGGNETWPQETLKLKDYIVDFHGWVEILQLHYLRDRLTFGLQTHLFYNPMLHILLPSTAILYSPVDFAFHGGSAGTGTKKGNNGGSRLGSRVNSRAGSRAGSRPPSSLGYYVDGGGEDLTAIDQFYLQQLQQQANRVVDRKNQKAEAARLRHVQRNKERESGHGRGGGKSFDELEY
ncbi:Interferon- developmental regulator 1 [Linnemannia exigua]|uniref:Interferon- developmental regulator 1 n=1 Tax=Linnemannia exigua TaxID=604196 RepID=A0AAD4D699_9FUNG|nr:Interferon- developmental regulator 1 [Linnemannia exigua]